jgi:hypothetical protein
MADKFLRGKEPLTFWRGANGAAGGYLYRGGLLEPERIDAKDAERLVTEGFLEHVVRDGEQFRLAEDTPTGSKGDPVTVGDNGFPPESEKANDIGTTNSEVMSQAEEQRRADAEADAKAKADAEQADKQAKADADIAERRTAAKAKVDALNGAAPDGRASKDVWVEYLATKGYAYDELIKQDKSDLVELAK